MIIISPDNFNNHFVIEKLDYSHKVSEFNCDNDNEYTLFLKQDAMKHQESHISNTFMLIEKETSVVAAYISLIADSVTLQDDERARLLLPDIAFETLPAKVRKSITYDNGLENALHERTNKVLGTKSYFCNPYHSWEKGTVENIIGIIRRFYPKKTDWKNVSQWDLNRIAKYINNRPMKLLDFKTPYQVFIALAA
ncbi:MAG: IS30 family transposase [Treponema sp.]|nr:IS30 family transposase [Treponema sp.]